MSSKTILIVDDDRDMRLLLEKRLRANGFQCLCVSSVQEAVGVLKAEDPDLILLDLMFREIDGTALLRHIQKREGRAVPVIVVSGCSDRDVVDYVIENGACGFIRKPIVGPELIAMIKEYAP